MTILVVEDSPVLGPFLKASLEMMGQTCRLAVDGAMAWNLVQQEDFDVIISDWMMPEMDGLDLCRRIRQREGRPYAYVIVLTAKSQRTDRLQALRAGADDYLVKPVHLGELAARLAVASRIIEMQARLGDAVTFLEAANRRFADIYMDLPIACINFDLDYRIQEWNQTCESLFGIPAEQAIQKPLWKLVCRSEEANSLRTSLGAALVGKKVENIEWVYAHPDGDPRYLLCHAFPLHGAHGDVVGAISAHVDLTARKLLEARLNEQLEVSTQLNIALEQQRQELAEANVLLEELAVTDGLTHLKNQRYFMQALENAFGLGKRYGHALSMIMLDVDHFKSHNDTFGHLAGDEVLRRLGSLLAGHVRKVDLVARYGGEEFAILLPATDAAGAIEVAERLRHAVAEHAWNPAPIRVSMGVASLHPGTCDHIGLVDEADQALYQSKRQGRDRVTHYRDLQEPRDVVKAAPMPDPDALG